MNLPTTDLTHGQTLAKFWNDGRSPIEAVLRYWRARYEEMGTRELQRPGQDQDTRLEEVKEQCINRCRSGLVGEGATLEAADRLARCITQPPGHFKACLDDLRARGIEMAAKTDGVEATATASVF